MRQAWPAHPEVPISKAVRAGDFVFTSAYGPWTFDPAKVVFDDAGAIVDDGSGLRRHAVRRAGASDLGLRSGGADGCRLHASTTSSSASAGLPMPATSLPSTRSTAPTSPRIHRCARSFPSRFMFACKIEMQVIAYRPQRRRLTTVHARVQQVVTFAAEPFRGNPAFVVSLDEDTSAELLQAIAAQFGDGVMAVLGPQDGDASAPALRHGGRTHPGPATPRRRPQPWRSRTGPRSRSPLRTARGGGSGATASRVVVPWPAMPWTASDARADAGRRARPSARPLSRSPSSAMWPSMQTRRWYAIWRRTWRPCRARPQCRDRDGSRYHLGHRDPGLRAQGRVARRPGLRHRASDHLTLLVRAPWPESLHSRHLSPRGGDLWCEFDGATVTIAGQTCRFLEGELLLPGA